MAEKPNHGWATKPSGSKVQAGFTETECKQPTFPPGPCCEPCPDCGGLECLCRPRFFAGQLLSEQDLNRLDHYITEKHKLHNRHLFGSGVVCGLEVRCAPCDELVTVSPGYALSPCGEDIVVCKPDTVDICELIARCRDDHDPDCRPFAGQESCKDVIEDWILAIRYAETPSRGITALTGAGQGCQCSCGGKCGCSGSCGGNCGCRSAGKPVQGCCGPVKGEPPPLKTPRLNRGVPPSCEPTLICEGYRYEVFKAPADDPKGADDPQSGIVAGLAGATAQFEGDLFARIACCMQQLAAYIPPFPGDPAQPIPANKRQEWFSWCCRVRQSLANYLAKIGGHDCEAIERLQTVVCPDPQQDVVPFKAALDEALKVYVLIVFEATIACFCSAALPPCPPPGDPRVPLAVVKIRKGDCHIISVCNWTLLRKHVLTFRTLEYWFGWLPIIGPIRQAMHLICCDLFGLKEQFEPEPDFTFEAGPSAELPEGAGGGEEGVVAFAQPSEEVVGAEAGVETKKLGLSKSVNIDPLRNIDLRPPVLQEAMARHVAGGQPLQMMDLIQAAFTRPSVGSPSNLNAAERETEIARLAGLAPVKVLGSALTPIASLLAGGPRMTAGVGGDAELAELKRTVARQGEELEVLKATIAAAKHS